MANDHATQKQILSIAKSLYNKYKDDFVQWTVDCIDFTGLKCSGLTEQQKEIAASLVHSKNLCVSAGGGIGKSAEAALLAIWFLSCHPHAKVITTAPTGKQLNDVLWGEISFWLRRYKFRDMIESYKGRMVVKCFSEWYAVARTVSKDSRQLNDTLAGFHAQHLLIIVDEASGVPDPVYTALDGAMTDNRAMILLISNPVSTAGYYYDTISDPDGKGKNWSILFFDSRESPLVDKSFEERIAARYGKDSPMYRSKVMGMPILATDAFVITPSEYDDLIANNRELQYGRIVLAVDVGGMGEDPSVICHRSGNSIIAWSEYAKNDTTYLVGEIERIAINNYSGRDIVVIVDALGLGAGVYDMLRQNNKVTTLAFVGSEKAFHETMYTKKRDEGYHKLHKQIKDLHFPIAPPEQLKKELVNTEFDYSAGIVQLKLSKKDLKKRIGHSPDYADALMMSCAVENFAVQNKGMFVSKGASVTMTNMLIKNQTSQKYGKYAKFF